MKLENVSENTQNREKENNTIVIVLMVYVYRRYFKANFITTPDRNPDTIPFAAGLSDKPLNKERNQYDYYRANTPFTSKLTEETRPVNTYCKVKSFTPC